MSDIDTMSLMIESRDKRIKQLEDVIEEVRQTQDMLYDERYNLQAWRENHIVTEQIFHKALDEEK